MKLTFSLLTLCLLFASCGKSDEAAISQMPATPTPVEANHAKLLAGKWFFAGATGVPLFLGTTPEFVSDSVLKIDTSRLAYRLSNGRIEILIPTEQGIFTMPFHAMIHSDTLTIRDTTAAHTTTYYCRTPIAWQETEGTKGIADDWVIESGSPFTHLGIAPGVVMINDERSYRASLAGNTIKIDQGAYAGDHNVESISADSMYITIKGNTYAFGRWKQ